MSLKDTSHTHNLEDIKNSNIVIRDENNNICSKLSDDKFTGYKLKNGTDLIDIFETKKISIDIKIFYDLKCITSCFPCQWRVKFR